MKTEKKFALTRQIPRIKLPEIDLRNDGGRQRPRQGLPPQVMHHKLLFSRMEPKARWQSHKSLHEAQRMQQNLLLFFWYGTPLGSQEQELTCHLPLLPQKLYNDSKREERRGGVSFTREWEKSRGSFYSKGCGQEGDDSNAWRELDSRTFLCWRAL